MVYGSDPRGFKHFPELRTRWVRAIGGPHSSLVHFSTIFHVSEFRARWSMEFHTAPRCTWIRFLFSTAGRSVQLLIAEFQGWINFYRRRERLSGLNFHHWFSVFSNFSHQNFLDFFFHFRVSFSKELYQFARLMFRYLDKRKILVRESTRSETFHTAETIIYCDTSVLLNFPPTPPLTPTEVAVFSVAEDTGHRK